MRSTAGSGTTLNSCRKRSRSVPCWLAGWAVSSSTIWNDSPKGSGSVGVNVSIVLASFQPNAPLMTMSLFAR